MGLTSVRLESDLEQSLLIEAKSAHRSKNWIINDALRKYLSHRKLEGQRWQDTLKALEDIRMGRVVDGSKVHAWLRTWGTDSEQEAPTE